MKKMLLVFISATMGFAFSAFVPQELTVEDLWYRDTHGNPVLYEGAVNCEPITPVCNVTIGDEIYRLYYDPQFTLPVFGRD